MLLTILLPLLAGAPLVLVSTASVLIMTGGVCVRLRVQFLPNHQQCCRAWAGRMPNNTKIGIGARLIQGVKYHLSREMSVDHCS